MKSVVVGKFQIVQRRNGDALTISLDTDLPDFTDVMVDVSRSYYERETSDEYLVQYFSEKTTVGAWRKPRTIRISHLAYVDALQERRKEVILANLGGTFDRVSPVVVTDFTVPVYQQRTDIFGQLNEHLAGPLVSADGTMRIVRAEVKEPFPIPRRLIPSLK